MFSATTEVGGCCVLEGLSTILFEIRMSILELLFQKVVTF